MLVILIFLSPYFLDGFLIPNIFYLPPIFVINVHVYFITEPHIMYVKEQVLDYIRRATALLALRDWK